MSRIDNARYNVGKNLLAIIISSTITTLIVFSIIPIDRENFSIALMQIIVIASIQAILIAVAVVFLFGKRPKRTVSS